MDEAYLVDWLEIASILTDERPEPGELWKLVANVVGSLEASRAHLTAEVERRLQAEAERDAALTVLKRLREIVNG